MISTCLHLASERKVWEERSAIVFSLSSCSHDDMSYAHLLVDCFQGDLENFVVNVHNYRRSWLVRACPYCTTMVGRTSSMNQSLRCLGPHAG